MIIAIDGPSGAGKSTLGKMLAKELNLLYLDTGAMYRAVGLAVFESGKDFYDAESVVEIARHSVIELIGEPDSLQVKLDGRDVSNEIRTNEVGQMASIVSTIPEVRVILVEHQRKLGENSGHGAVLDGRDIGTIVFPNHACTSKCDPCKQGIKLLAAIGFFGDRCAQCGIHDIA